MFSVACSGSDSSVVDEARRDVLTIATPADPDALLPPLVQTTQGKQVVDLIFDHLAQPGDRLEMVGDSAFRPQLAEGWTWSTDSLSIAFALNPRARWHDGVHVRANDVAFSFALYRDTALASPHQHAFDGIDSVTVADSVTAVAWWSKRHPEQFSQLAFNLAILPQHLLDTVSRSALASSSFASRPVGSGRYKFDRWTPHQELVLSSDGDNYRGAPGISRVIWIVTADPVAANLSVISGQTDVLEQLRGDAFVKVSQSDNIKAVEYGSYDYAYLTFNSVRTIGGQARFFDDRTVRVALTAAIDRRAVVTNALDSIGSVALGPVTRANPSADTNMIQIVFDSARANRMLDSLGWTRDVKSGSRKRAGHDLEFEILVPSTSNTRQRVAVLLQSQLRRVGVATTIASVEPGVFYARMSEGEFDTALNMWHSDPSPSSIAAVWGSPRGKDAGMNFGRYSNSHVDLLLDSASNAFDVAKRVALQRRVHQEIVDDAAAIWLYEPRNFAAVNSRIVSTGMRADAWWANIADWRVARQDAATLASRP